MKAKRKLNECDNGHTWYPRGKEISHSCPTCGSKQIKIKDSSSNSFGLFWLIIAISIGIWYFNSSSSSKGLKNEPPVDTKESAKKKSSDQDETNSIKFSPSNSHEKNELDNEARENKNFFDKIPTKEEIYVMEKEKQYHGDDPVVRARLGLPSKN